MVIRHVRTAAKLAVGFAALVIGIVLSLPGVPGPGIVTILFGLWLLSDHFHWARKTLEWAKERVERIKRRTSAPARGGSDSL